LNGSQENERRRKKRGSRKDRDKKG